MTDPLVILCPSCRQPLERGEVIDQTDKNPRIDFYACPREGCQGNKIAVFFEVSGQHTHEPGFVEREIARRGAFFPADFQGNRGGGRSW